MICGWLLVTAYKSSPGAEGPIPLHWPGGASVLPATDRSTLVLFIHPQCPCSTATIGELARLIADCGSQLRTYAFFLRPQGVEDNWEKTGTWRSACAIPGVIVCSDPLGKEATRFGARTSGEAILYSAEGDLQFHGGITWSRGHEGDSPGGDAIRAKLKNAGTGLNEAPVFGCPLTCEEEK